MVQPELQELLSRCPDSTGCFASDPEALQAMLHYGDSVMTADIRDAAVAANYAGRVGIALENVGYARPYVRVVGRMTAVDHEGRQYDGVRAVVGRQGPSQRIEEPAEDASDAERMRYRVAACAHACGSRALSCPVIVGPAASSGEVSSAVV